MARAQLFELLNPVNIGPGKNLANLVGTMADNHVDVFATKPACGAVSITWCSRGFPPSGWSTLGRLEHMRVPCPAARIIMLRGILYKISD